MNSRRTRTRARLRARLVARRSSTLLVGERGDVVVPAVKNVEPKRVERLSAREFPGARPNVGRQDVRADEVLCEARVALRGRVAGDERAGGEGDSKTTK